MQRDTSLNSTSKIPKIVCPNHPTQVLYSVCLQESCSIPYNCTECEAEYSKDHPHTFRSLDTIFHDKTSTKYAKVLESKFSLQKIASTKDEMLLILQTIEEDFRKMIGKMVQIVNEDFEKLKTEVERRRSAIKTFEELKNIS